MLYTLLYPTSQQKSWRSCTSLAGTPAWVGMSVFAFMEVLNPTVFCTRSGQLWPPDCPWWLEGAPVQSRGQPPWSAGGKQLRHPLPQVQRSLPEGMLAAGGESLRRSSTSICIRLAECNISVCFCSLSCVTCCFFPTFHLASTSKSPSTWLRAASLCVPLKKHSTRMPSSRPEIWSSCWPEASLLNRWHNAAQRSWFSVHVCV